MKTTTSQTKEKIFLALTQIYRAINNNKPISWFGTFKQAGITNVNTIAMVKNTLVYMHILKINGARRNTSYQWNKSMCAPSPQLVEGILIKSKELPNKQVQTKKTTKIISQPEYISLTYSYPHTQHTTRLAVSCVSITSQIKSE